MLQVYSVSMETERFIILLKVHKLRKRRIDLSVCSNLADGILTVTLKGGMPQKYTGRKSLAKIFSDH